ncbi:hypothetical protein WG66_004751 [Moniliophthora roreri]|nr:hypothetical protein WG66_004751 [Moniliophthora roreri]
MPSSAMQIYVGRDAKKDEELFTKYIAIGQFMKMYRSYTKPPAPQISVHIIHLRESCSSVIVSGHSV